MKWQRGVLAVVVAAHVAAMTWIAADYRRSDNPFVLTAVSALPAAQLGLLAAWSVLSIARSYLRFGVLVLGGIALWALEGRTLNLPLENDRSAAHALTFAVQALLLAGVLLPICFVARSRHGTYEPRQRRQFGISSLLGWVTVTALILGAGRLVLSRAEWTTDVIHGRLFLMGLVVGIYQAIFSLIALGAATWGRNGFRLAAQGLLAIGLAASLAVSQPIVLRRLLEIDGNVETVLWMSLVAFQAFYVLITVIPIRLCRSDQAKESSHETSPGCETCLAHLPHTA